jgi:hypothetical protein
MQAGYWFDAIDAFLGRGADAESRAAADQTLAADGPVQSAPPAP